MPQISFNIPVGQVPFMMELLKKLKFVNNTAIQGDFTFSEQHKDLIEVERKKCKENPDYLVEWDSIEAKLKL